MLPTKDGGRRFRVATACSIPCASHYVVAADWDRPAVRRHGVKECALGRQRAAVIDARSQPGDVVMRMIRQYFAFRRSRRTLLGFACQGVRKAWVGAADHAQQMVF